MLRSTAALTVALVCAAPPTVAAEHDCMIEARQTVEIRSSVEAVIESVKVKRGDFVSKSQVIVTLESGPERAALALANQRPGAPRHIQVRQARVDTPHKK